MRVRDLGGPRNSDFYGVNLRCNKCGMTHGVWAYGEESWEELEEQGTNQCVCEEAEG